jgi:hypothetical protein
MLPSSVKPLSRWRVRQLETQNHIGRDQHARGFGDGAIAAARGSWLHSLQNGSRRARFDRVLLQILVHGQQHRAVGRRQREFVGAARGFGEMRQGYGRVIEFREVANQRRSVEHGMLPVDVAAALRGVELCSDYRKYGYAVGPGVIDRHGPVLQAHGRIHHACHGFAGDLGVTMRDGDRNLLVHA